MSKYKTLLIRFMEEKNHIVKAKHILISNIDKNAQNILSKDELIVTYSEDFDCPASTIAAAKLEKMGFKNMMDFKGSYKEWFDAGYPTE